MARAMRLAEADALVRLIQAEEPAFEPQRAYVDLGRYGVWVTLLDHRERIESTSAWIALRRRLRRERAK